MKIEKTIEGANITDYIESVEILDGGKLKVIFDIPDNILELIPNVVPETIASITGPIVISIHK